MFSFFALVEGANRIHVLAYISGRKETRAEAADLLRVVEVAHDDRNAGGRRDVVEAGFPILDVGTRSFGRDDESEVIVIVEGFRQDRDQIFALVAANRNFTNTTDSLNQSVNIIISGHFVDP